LLGNVAINNNSSSQRAVFTSFVRNNESNLKLSIPQNTVPLPDLRNLNSKNNVEEISNGSFFFLARLAEIYVNQILYKYNPKGGNIVYAQLLTLYLHRFETRTEQSATTVADGIVFVV